MGNGVRGAIIAVIAAVAGAAIALSMRDARGESNVYVAPRTPDGKADLNGIWQAMNTANWDLQPHAARQGPVVALGAAFSVPGGLGVVEGNDIPYTAAALVKKKENADNWLTRDPEIKCYLPGVPRATYMPHPFQIVQTASHVLLTYEPASASRIVYMITRVDATVDAWMGTSNGRWDGDTLVVDVTGLDDRTWFDRAGNHHSDALHVTERYTRVSPDAIQYEATIEDAKTFTKPWKVRMPLYRRVEKDVQLMEYKCPEFAEELMYGSIRKRTGN